MKTDLDLLKDTFDKIKVDYKILTFENRNSFDCIIQIDVFLGFKFLNGSFVGLI